MCIDSIGVKVRAGVRPETLKNRADSDRRSMGTGVAYPAAFGNA